MAYKTIRVSPDVYDMLNDHARRAPDTLTETPDKVLRRLLKIKSKENGNGN